FAEEAARRESVLQRIPKGTQIGGNVFGRLLFEVVSRFMSHAEGRLPEVTVLGVDFLSALAFGKDGDAVAFREISEIVRVVSGYPHWPTLGGAFVFVNGDVVGEDLKGDGGQGAPGA